MMHQLANWIEVQLTTGSEGYFINHTQCFSPDDQWIVYDARKDDSQLMQTGTIGVVNTNTGEVTEIYRTKSQTDFGPGVGAATFSPTGNNVLFLHGIRNANEQHPYGFTRRTGVAVNIKHPFVPIFMDARDICPPFTPGALRGGTHAHSTSGDGEWISFTYNDYVLEQLGKEDANVKDLRTVGVMMPGSVLVKRDCGMENHSGEMFSAVVTHVTEHPTWGSDEIEKAFDECWIGSEGYIKADTSRQGRAIAFQGNVRDEDGRLKTEVFVVDLPDDIKGARPGKPLEGTATSRPNVPEGVHQRRILFSKNGIEGPRHWLRCKRDGSMIAYLAKDEAGHIQIFGISPNGGVSVQITHNPFSIQGSFNFSPDDSCIAYIADNSIFFTILSSGETRRVSKRFNDRERPKGGVVWSYKGDMLAYNRYPEQDGLCVPHIFLLKHQSS